MAEDRLRRDYDLVENLEDLITARDERVSAFADDVDAMDDVSPEGLPVDPNVELTWPHPKTREDEYGKEGINVELMDTPDEAEVEFDWQDNAEEMISSDPEPSEGMGADGAIISIAHIAPSDLTGPVPSTELSPEMDTDATDEEKERYGLDGGDQTPTPVQPIPLETGMDTDSDEYDFSIEDRFAGQIPRETAEYEFEEMKEAEEDQDRG